VISKWSFPLQVFRSCVLWRPTYLKNIVIILTPKWWAVIRTSVGGGGWGEFHLSLCLWGSLAWLKILCNLQYHIYFPKTEAQDIVQNYSFVERIDSMTNVWKEGLQINICTLELRRKWEIIFANRLKTGFLQNNIQEFSETFIMFRETITAYCENNLLVQCRIFDMLKRVVHTLTIGL
jgi:hypothetical protein